MKISSDPGCELHISYHFELLWNDFMIMIPLKNPNLFNLLAGDPSFKWVFAYGIVSMVVLSLLTMNHPYPFTCSPPYLNFAIPPRKLTICQSTNGIWWFKNQQFRGKWVYLHNWVQFSVLDCSCRKYCTSCNFYL